MIIKEYKTKSVAWYKDSNYEDSKRYKKSTKSEPMGVGVGKFTRGGNCTDVVRIMA